MVILSVSLIRKESRTDGGKVSVSGSEGGALNTTPVSVCALSDCPSFLLLLLLVTVAFSLTLTLTRTSFSTGPGCDLLTEKNNHFWSTYTVPPKPAGVGAIAPIPDDF